MMQCLQLQRNAALFPSRVHRAVLSYHRQNGKDPQKKTEKLETFPANVFTRFCRHRKTFTDLVWEREQNLWSQETTWE